MNCDIRILTTFRNNRKRRKLDILLGENSAGYLIDLWIGAALSKPDGVLVGWDKTDIAIEANYNGDTDKFFSALKESGFLDVDENGKLTLHNWKKRQKWAANDKERSVIASKKALKRWVLLQIAKKEYNDFCVWFDNFYEHDPENNAASTLAAYKQHANSIANSIYPDANGNAPSPSPYPLPKDIHGKYGTFNNVTLSQEDFNNLTAQFNGKTEGMIEALSVYMESKGKRYKNHYATILAWARRDGIVAGAGKSANKCQQCTYTAQNKCHKHADERATCTAFQPRVD